MSPPIRGAGTAAKLKDALAGGALSIVATDHAVFNSTQKRAGRHDYRSVPAVNISVLPVRNHGCSNYGSVWWSMTNVPVNIRCQHLAGQLAWAVWVISYMMMISDDVTSATQSAFAPYHVLCVAPCRKIPNGVNGIEERLHVVWQEMVVSGDHTRITASACNGVTKQNSVKQAAMLQSSVVMPMRNKCRCSCY
jgi:hypothetical protein